MNTRLPHTLPSPKLETRDSDEPTPCADAWPIFDTLIDHAGGPAYRGALRVAKQMCGGCPIAATCLRENAEEQWAQAVVRPERKKVAA